MLALIYDEMLLLIRTGKEQPVAQFLVRLVKVEYSRFGDQLYLTRKNEGDLKREKLFGVVWRAKLLRRSLLTMLQQRSCGLFVNGIET